MPRLAPVRSIVRRGWLEKEEVDMNWSLTIRRKQAYHSRRTLGSSFRESQPVRAKRGQMTGSASNYDAPLRT
jgi:hypothetical protein